MARSAKGKLTGGLIAGEPGKRFSEDPVGSAEQHIMMLSAATSLKGLETPPSNNLKELSGSRQGRHSIRINLQWRICFRWDGTDARDVEIVDYH